MCVVVNKTMLRGYCLIANAVMITVFIINLLVSGEHNLLWISLSGGGDAVALLGISYKTVFSDFQIYRLITYGFTHSAIWHLLANAFALWYVGLCFEEKIGITKFVLIYHVGLAAAGVLFVIILPESFSYGASPAIFACLGMLSRWLANERKLWHEYKNEKGFYYLMCYLVFSNFLGIGTFLIHLLGFCIGFVSGGIVRPEEKI